MIANAITCVRIVGTVCLLFVTPLTPLFFAIYTFSAVSDLLDGIVARATKTTSELGAKLDSIADLLFYGVMFLQVMPILIERLPALVWWMVLVIIILRVTSYTIVAVKFKRFSSQHTYLNKLTGGTVFTVPYFLLRAWDWIACACICVIAILAALEEVLIHLSSKEYRQDRKTILMN